MIAMISIALVQETVGAHYALSKSDLLSARKLKRLARPRQVAMYLARRVTRKSLTQIGRAFHRDHTNVIYAIRKIEKLAYTDCKLATDITALTWVLAGKQT